MPSSTSTSGLSVAAFSSIDDRVLDVVEQVARRAVHLRRAAQRVRVLHLVAPAVRLDDRRALEQPRARSRADAGWPRSGRSAWICGMNASREPCSASSESAHAQSAACASRRARTSPSAPCAAMNCVPLISDSPSFATQPHRLEPGALERVGAVEQLAVEPRLALADERQREVRERREVAATRRPSRAPARAAGRRGSGTRAAARRSRRARRSCPSRARSRAAASPRARPRPGTARRRRTRASAAGAAAAPRSAPPGSSCETKRPKPVLTP